MALWGAGSRVAAALGMVVVLGATTLRSAEKSPEKEAAILWVDAHADALKAINHKIWSYAEVGLQETRSAAELKALLKANGFALQEGVAGMPTAFVASYGSGHPVLGILAEYDALPGLSQEAVPERKAREGSAAGHGCGHCLFGTASTGAAVAVKEFLAARKGSGTVRLYGTPAEETGIGKVFMARSGVFDDCDLVLHWHPADVSHAAFSSTKAIVSVKYSFHGVASHASVSPHLGRSALDGVELMDVGANFLREHVKQDARIHYVITDGGGQPNVVPPEAQVWYYLRSDSHTDLEGIFQRMQDIAQGAALMTGTRVDTQVITDNHDVLPNRPLSELLQRNLELVGPPRFSDDEKAFARKSQAGMDPLPERALSEALDPLPAEPVREPPSTDVGEVSWRIPTGGLEVATQTFGAGGHSWQNAACAGTSIGEKGMLVAAKVLAASAVEAFLRPEVLSAAHEDFLKRKAGRPFRSLLPPDARVPQAIR